MRRTLSLSIEILSWTVGVLALLAWAVIGGSGRLAAHAALQQFEALSAAGDAASVAMPDQRQWSSTRVRAWHDAPRRAAPPPLAVLRIPRISLQVPVLEGVDEWTLNRAVGRIQETAMPGDSGNIGIAGHRDGFFRNLEHLRTGDVLEIESLTGTDFYRVERTWIVEPDDVSVVDSTSERSVTLVTCYPFYFVGSAPQRFIARGLWTHSTPRQGRSN